MINKNSDEFTLDLFIKVTFIKHKNSFSCDFYDYLNFIHILNDEKHSELLKSSIKSRLLRNGKMRFFIEVLKTYYGIIIEKIHIKELDLILYNLCNKELREYLKQFNFNLKINLFKHFEGSIYLSLLKHRFLINPLHVYSQEDFQMAIKKDNFFKNLCFFTEFEDISSFSSKAISFNNIFMIFEKASDKNFLSVFYHFLYFNLSKLSTIYLDFYYLSHFAKFQSTIFKLIFEKLINEIEELKEKMLIICDNSDHLDNDLTKVFNEKLLELAKRYNKRLFVLNINTISNKSKVDLKEIINYEFNSNMIMEISKRFMERNVEIYDKGMMINLIQDINKYNSEEILSSKQSLYEFIFYKAKKIDFIELEKLVNPIF